MYENKKTLQYKQVWALDFDGDIGDAHEQLPVDVAGHIGSFQQFIQSTAKLRTHTIILLKKNLRQRLRESFDVCKAHSHRVSLGVSQAIEDSTIMATIHRNKNRKIRNYNAYESTDIQYGEQSEFNEAIRARNSTGGQKRMFLHANVTVASNSTVQLASDKLYNLITRGNIDG